MPGMRLPLVLALACLAALAATQATDYAAATSLAIEWGLENSSWPTNPPCTATGPCRTWPGVTWVGDRITEMCGALCVSLPLTFHQRNHRCNNPRLQYYHRDMAKLCAPHRSHHIALRS